MSKQEFIEISIGVHPIPRGNHHGYAASDYAKDAAAEINSRLSSDGGYTIICGDQKSIDWAIDRALEEIDSCDDMFRHRLFVDQRLVELDIDE